MPGDFKLAHGHGKSGLRSCQVEPNSSTPARRRVGKAFARSRNDALIGPVPLDPLTHFFQKEALEGLSRRRITGWREARRGMTV